MIRFNRFDSSKPIRLSTLASAVVLAGSLGISNLVLADGATNDVQACYAWSIFPNERINIGVRNGGPLTAPGVTPSQRTHGIHGKHVGSCGEGTNAALSGVLVFKTGIGSHLGLYSPQSRGEERFNSDDHCRSVSIECYSDQAVRAPTQWTCQSRNEFGVYHGESTLTLVAVDTAPDDEFCGVFEDKDRFEDSNEYPSGVGSGMRPDGDNDH